MATDEDAWDTLRTVERQNNRLSRLVHDLLLLFRVDLQRFSAKRFMAHLPAILIMQIGFKMRIAEIRVTMNNRPLAADGSARL